MSHTREIIRPCPFCGGKADVATAYHEHSPSCRWYAQVICEKCLASVGIPSGYYMNEAEAIRKAIASWNRRLADGIGFLMEPAKLCNVEQFEKNAAPSAVNTKGG